MRNRKVFVLASLMIVGECIFLLPFVVSRIFRPTFLSVFEINNFQLGSAFAVYGLVAMGSYFFGGPIADKFSAKKLIIFSLLLTAAGGLFMAQIPNLVGLTILYGFWGLSTILFFWAAYVKATREFGGNTTQGLAFGSVDGGRGLFAALLASSSVFIFSAFLPVDVSSASDAQMATALGNIIYLFCGAMVLCCLLIWFFVPDSGEDTTPKSSVTGVKFIISQKVIWIQAIILMCAYVGYKVTDDFSLYASDVMGFNDVNSAHVGTVSFWMRPIAAIAAGLLGDRHQFAKITGYCFLVVVVGALVIASGVLTSTGPVLVIISIAFTSAGIYGLRGLYFALFQQSKIPIIYTGSAAGVVSCIGYLPDIFMGPLMGILLDNNPGELGHQYVFVVLGAFACLGFIMSILFTTATKNS